MHKNDKLDYINITVFICILLLQLSTFIWISTIGGEYSFDIYLHIERLLTEVCVNACAHIYTHIHVYMGFVVRKAINGNI